MKDLKNLLNAFGPSGFEENALDVFNSMFNDDFEIYENEYNVQLIRANLGSKSKEVAIYGHIDEVGFMVINITSEGFLKVSTIGSVDQYILPGSRVKILNQSGDFINGVFGSTAVHLIEDLSDRKIKMNQLFIDVGAKDKDEVLEMGIDIGSPMVFADKALQLNDDIITTKAADDRLGVYIAAQVAIECCNLKNAGVSAIATCQEENGLYGSRMSREFVTSVFDPDFNIAVDVCHSIDTPGLSKDEFGDIEIGKGPVIGVGSVNNKHLTKNLISVAKDNAIPYQMSANPIWSGTDADELLFMSGGMVPTIIVSVPLRYMHTQNEMFSITDVKNTIKLLTKFCEAI